MIPIPLEHTTKKEIERIDKELKDKLIEMPEDELIYKRMNDINTFQTQDDKDEATYLNQLKAAKRHQQEIASGVIEDELIHKRMNDINTFQAHENEVYLRGTDEYGKDFQICFDSYNFLEWIDTENLEYIKEQLIKYIQKK